MDHLSSSSSVLERTECCGTTPIGTVANASLKPGRHRSMQEKVWLFFVVVKCNVSSKRE